MQFTVLSYNIRHGLGSDGRVDCGRIGDVIAGSGADIVCLQEVDRGLPRTSFLYQSEWLGQSLGFHQGFHANFGLVFAGMGNAILSRFPIHSTWNSSLPFLGEPRGLLHSVIELDGVVLNVLCTHWGLSPGQRLQQSRKAAEVLRRIEGPIVLCGDLNAARSSVEVNLLLAQGGLTDAGPAERKTYPAVNALVKIDFILVGGALGVVRSSVLETEASDHLPVSARIEYSGN